MSNHYTSNDLASVITELSPEQEERFFTWVHSLQPKWHEKLFDFMRHPFNKAVRQENTLHNRVLSTLFRNTQTLSRKLEHAEADALIDQLTGAYNRRYFERELQNKMDQIERNGGNIIVALVDLDLFKEINDTYGHAVGDEALKTAVSFLNRQARGYDVVARLGGDEFALIIDGENLTPKILSERITRGFENVSFIAGLHNIDVRGSIGTVALNAQTIKEKYQNIGAVLAAADYQLYQDKGRQRGRSADQPPQEERRRQLIIEPGQERVISLEDHPGPLITIR